MIKLNLEMYIVSKILFATLNDYNSLSQLYLYI
jgi:hypothetical protein